MLINELHAAELGSPYQTIRARVEIYKDSTLEKTCNCGKDLSDFTIERAGENRFFGFGICQKLKANFLDEQSVIGMTKEHHLEVSFGVDDEFLYAFPKFYVEEVSRDEETNDITAIAYDGLYKAANHKVSELASYSKSTLQTYAEACAALLGFTLKIENVYDSCFSEVYLSRKPAKQPSFSGEETIRSVLDSIAEITQTIYYVNNNEELVFKRLDRDGDSVYTINRSNYSEFYSRGNRTLGKVVHYTELGDNIVSDEPSTVVEGATQYIRNNPFWSSSTSIATLVDNAQAAIGGLSIDQFECNWFGNYLLEIGDKISIVGKENKTITTFLLEDSLTFDGAIDQFTKWEYNENEAETAANPTSLGEALNQTYARVDKANKKIELVASETSANSQSISTLQLTTEGITASVSKMQETVDTTTKNLTSVEMSMEGLAVTVGEVYKTQSTHSKAITQLELTTEGITASVSEMQKTVDTTTESMAELQLTTESIAASVEEVKTTAESNTSAISALQINTDSISASVKKIEETAIAQVEDLEEEVSKVKTDFASFKLTSDEALLEFKTEIEENGVAKVSGKGYSFSEEGFKINAEGSAIETTITEDGMSITKSGEEVLRADSEGVRANDLHATSWLIIGNNSRLEDYADVNGNKRTGCFWIGG